MTTSSVSISSARRADARSAKKAAAFPRQIGPTAVHICLRGSGPLRKKSKIPSGRPSMRMREGSGFIFETRTPPARRHNIRELTEGNEHTQPHRLCDAQQNRETRRPIVTCLPLDSVTPSNFSSSNCHYLAATQEACKPADCIARHKMHNDLCSTIKGIHSR